MESNIKKEEEEEDVKIKLEDEEDDNNNDIEHGDADVELLRVMKVETACNHLHSRNTVGSTILRSHIDGTKRCDVCGKVIRTDTANSCRICDGVFCLSHRFTRKRARHSKPSKSSQRTTRKRLPEFIRKLEIDRIDSYIDKCDPHNEQAPDVEAFTTWAFGVFSGMITEDQKFVPQAVKDMVRTKWESQQS